MTIEDLSQAAQYGGDAGVPPAPFVVGVARSGTTLLRLMLDAHPALAVPPETWFLFRVVRLRGADRKLPERLFDVLTGSSMWKSAGLSRRALRRELESLEPFELAEGVRCFYRLYAARQGKQRWGDKTPGYASLLDKIARLLPEARFIHIVRDGRDVALSLRELWFAPARDIRGLAAHWQEQIRTARRLGRGCRYLEVRFEDLVREPHEELQRIAAFVDLPYDQAMERYFLSARRRLGEVRGPAARASLRLTGEPPQPSRIGCWRHAMTRDERAMFERVGGKLLRELGYETGPARPRRP